MKIEYISTGLYKADFYDCNKRRCRPTIEAPNKKEATRIAKRMAREGLEPQIQTTGGMPLVEALRRADIEHYRGTKNHHKTITIAEKLKEAFGETRPIKQLTTEVIKQEGTLKWREEGLSSSTINARLSMIQKVLKLATEWSYQSKPALTTLPKITRLKKSQGRTRVLTEAEEKKGLEFFTGRDRALFPILIDTGMRLSEALGMFYKIDGEAHKIIDWRETKKWFAFSEINLQDRKIHIWESKGGRNRTIPMSDRVYKILTGLSREEPYNLQPFPAPTNREKGKFTPDSVGKRWGKFRTFMNLEGDKELTPHCCRHTSCTRMWERTGDIKQVQEWHGHANVLTTERYTHLSSDSLDSYASMMSKMSINVPELDNECLNVD